MMKSRIWFSTCTRPHHQHLWTLLVNMMKSRIWFSTCNGHHHQKLWTLLMNMMRSRIWFSTCTWHHHQQLWTLLMNTHTHTHTQWHTHTLPPIPNHIKPHPPSYLFLPTPFHHPHPHMILTLFPHNSWTKLVDALTITLVLPPFKGRGGLRRWCTVGGAAKSVGHLPIAATPASHEALVCIQLVLGGLCNR